MSPVDWAKRVTSEERQAHSKKQQGRDLTPPAALLRHQIKPGVPITRVGSGFRCQFSLISLFFYEFRQGAFQGRTAKEAYLVKCDSETTTQADIDLGIVNILVAFAPLKPAEFVILRIQQLAGQIPT